MSKEATTGSEAALPKPEKDPIVTLTGKLYARVPYLAAQYKILLKGKNALTASSMVFAYTKGLNDAIKFFLKKENQQDEKPVQAP